MMGNYHIPFFRAVEVATPSLTLIIQNIAVGLTVIKAQRVTKALAGVAEKPLWYA
jgi:hypothetical protein